MTQERVEEESTEREPFFSEDEGVEEEYQASLDASEVPEAPEEGEEEEAPEEEPKAEAAGEPAPEKAPDPEPAPPAYSQEYVQQLEANMRQAQAQNEAAQAAQREQQYRQLEEDRQKQLLDAGLTPEAAASQAREIRGLQQQNDTLQQQSVQIQQEQQAKVVVASQYSKQYGVEISDLLRFNDPVSMEAHAKQSKEIADLKAQLGKVQKGQVPRQNRVDNGRSSRPVGSRSRRMEELSGKENLTEKELGELQELLER